MKSDIELNGVVAFTPATALKNVLYMFDRGMA